MKKTVFALAVLGLFAGAASAQSSVTLSGGVDQGWARVDGDNQIRTAGSYRSAMTISGKEDLGGGMYASFLMNHRFNPDEGTVNRGGNNSGDTNQFWRNSFVELGSGMGALRVGRFLTPLQEVNGDYDPFGTDTVGSTHTGGIAGNVRVNNAVEYRSPKFGGAQLLAMGAESQGQGDTGTAAKPLKKVMGVALKFGFGGFHGALATDKRANQIKTNGLYLGYKFGGGTNLVMQYESGDPSTTATEKVKRYSLGAKIPVGATDVKLGYTNWSDEKKKKLGIGADYNLSKRTQLYADVGKQSGDGFTDTQRKAQFDLGIFHRF